ncbi:MAG: hypothetical protein LC734_08890, partial [Acidobacteria bacterium]|nr:hypothetical protein [Acidobacteriota bacterium]
MKPQTRGSAIFQKIAPQLVVCDVVKTAEHYRDVLGFEILDTSPNGPFTRWSSATAWNALRKSRDLREY